MQPAFTRNLDGKQENLFKKTQSKEKTQKFWKTNWAPIKWVVDFFGGMKQFNYFIPEFFNILFSVIKKIVFLK